MDTDFREILPLLKSLDNLIKQVRPDDSCEAEMLSAYRQNGNEKLL